MTSTCLFRVVKDREKILGHARHVHTSYQQISILTPNFNTSFVGHLTNVASLGYFTLTVFSFVFVERCFSCLAWVHQTLQVGGSFLTRTHVFWSRYVVLLDPAKTLVSLVLLLSGRQWWTSAELVALSISVYFCLLFTLPCLSLFFWNDTEKIGMPLRKC